MFPGYADLIARLDAGVSAGLPDAITAQVKADLEDLLGHSSLTLPERFRQPRLDSYARRLLYADPAGRYTVVVMTWGAGQATAVHDHGGLWCVEGVVEGEMVVTQFNVTDLSDGTFDVAQSGSTLRAGTGTAGRLIPPIDYHILGNGRDDPSVTLHVYGGSLDGCRVFLPRPDGRFEPHFRALSYHE